MKNLSFVEDDSGKLIRVSFLSDGRSIKEVHFNSNIDIWKIDYLSEGIWHTAIFNGIRERNPLNL